jgi:hypothetical protein
LTSAGISFYILSRSWERRQFLAHILGIAKAKRPAARLIALAVALESLFSPADGQEISFKTSLTASLLLGESIEQRKQIFADLQDLYKRRSKIVHGSYDVKKVYEGTFVTHEDIDRWSPYIREGVMRFLTMYFRGKRTREDLEGFRKELLLCAG